MLQVTGSPSPSDKLLDAVSQQFLSIDYKISFVLKVPHFHCNRLLYSTLAGQSSFHLQLHLLSCTFLCAAVIALNCTMQDIGAVNADFETNSADILIEAAQLTIDLLPRTRHETLNCGLDPFLLTICLVYQYLYPAAVRVLL